MLIMECENSSLINKYWEDKKKVLPRKTHEIQQIYDAWVSKIEQNVWLNIYQVFLIKVIYLHTLTLLTNTLYIYSPSYISSVRVYFIYCYVETRIKRNFLSTVIILFLFNTFVKSMVNLLTYYYYYFHKIYVYCFSSVLFEKNHFTIGVLEKKKMIKSFRNSFCGPLSLNFYNAYLWRWSLFVLMVFVLKIKIK